MAEVNTRKAYREAQEKEQHARNCRRFLKRSEYQHHGDQVAAFFSRHQDGQF